MTGPVGFAAALKVTMLAAVNNPAITIAFNFDVVFILFSWGLDLLFREFIFWFLF
jgi:hypothetical protein